MKFEVGETIRIPSPIDVHTHLREPGGTEKETIESGTLAARAGGYQAVFDMPNNPGGNETWSPGKLEEKYEIAEHSANTNIGFYAGVNLADPNLREMSRMIPRAAGLKIYFGHTTGNTEEYVLDHAREAIDTWVHDSQERHAVTGESVPPILIHAREGVGYEVADYIARQESPVHWCHLSTASEANMAAILREKHPVFTNAGVTPHHLTMTSIDADFKYGWPGARMMPPLADEVDHDALVDFYDLGVINILETDHAPHTEEQKFAAERENPEGQSDVNCTTCFGVSSIEFVLTTMMSLVQRGKISMERLEDSLYHQPKRMLGLNHAEEPATTTLEIGPYVIGEEDRVGKSRNNPYVGWTGWAKVIGVDMNGASRALPDAEFTPRILNTGSEV